ncbi:TonB C-terminal domain-containing protein [Pseudomonas sp. UFMG81]|uniref:TonB C-terminal domain-containing protein n=1 Tax=Pseudomonas sp. UFMG81 TaxID=2745936 RepID=UPI0018908234
MKQTLNSRRLLVAAGLTVLGVVGAWLLWQWANDMSGVRREAPKVPAIIPLPPPPPPPPEPPKEPEPPVEEKIAEPEPVPEAEEVKPAEEAPPNPAEDLANPMQMDGDAQSGSDAFNVGAGKGGGDVEGVAAGLRVTVHLHGVGQVFGGVGRCLLGRLDLFGFGHRLGLGTGTYNNYMASTLQKLLRDNPELRNQVFNLQVGVWLSETGEFIRVEVLRSSGDAAKDELIAGALRGAPPMAQRPPADMPMPVRMNLGGRRP